MPVLQSGFRLVPAVALAVVAVFASTAIAQAEPAQATGKSEVAWVLVLVVGMVFLICGPIAGWFIYTGYKGRALAQASQKWPTAPGKIIECRVQDVTRRTGKGGRTTTYLPIVRYEYAVGGTRYEADVIQFGMTEQGSMMKADAFLLERPVGAACTVHYDAADPKVATLDTSAKSAQSRIKVGWFIMFGAPALTVLVLGLIFWLA